MARAPFSQRFAGGEPWISNDFPESARVALLHLLHDLVDREYVDGWASIDKEVRRIARHDPHSRDRSKVSDIAAARSHVKSTLLELRWSLVLDFCERLHSHLAVAVTESDSFGTPGVPVIPREQVQTYIAEEVERIFLEERLGFTFEHGEIRARGRKHTRNQLAKIEPTFADPRLSEARQHFAKAMRFFDSKEGADFENVVKEAVCAVEAAAKRLFPNSKGKTLADVVKDLSTGRDRRIPKAIGDTLAGVYAFRNGGGGIAHGATGGDSVTRGLAEYVLAVSASQIILLHEIEAEAAPDIPF